MLFTTFLTLAVGASSALAAPAADPSAKSLKSWSLKTLNTFSPSGRPGNSPYSTLNATIYDPNTIPLQGTPTGEAVIPPSTGNCSTQWISTPPWGKRIACKSDSEYSKWSFVLTKGNADPPSGTENFTITFQLVDDVTVLGTKYHKVFLGGDHFQVGTNLAGECGGSGVCFWGLKKAPYAIKQKETK